MERGALGQKRDAPPHGILLTDLEASTQHLRSLGDAYPQYLAACLGLIRSAIGDVKGTEVGSEGDSIAAIFLSATEALRAAVSAQRSLHGHSWPDEPWRVRMAVHAGAVVTGRAGAVGVALHEAARLRNVAHGGQVVVSSVARDLVADEIPAGVDLVDLGVHELRDFDHPVRVWQAVVAGLRGDFPPLRARVVRVVPPRLSSFLGRATELAELTSTLEHNQVVTVVGAGGTGKSRLAFEVASDAEGFDAVHVVELANLHDEALVAPAIAGAVGAADAEVLHSVLGDTRVLLVLDNCEHVVGACARHVAALLPACPGLSVLATSREPMRLACELVWHIPPLSPTEAAELFMERARSAIDTETRDREAVATICARLDGMPLAIELAAARLRSLSLAELVARLDDQPALLTSGTRDVQRHETLRGTLDWSHALLEPDEQALLARLSAFTGGFALAAAEALSTEPTPLRVVDALDGLVLKSFVEFDRRSDRYGMLEPIRQYARDHLIQRGEAEEVLHTHARWVAGLVESANRAFFTDQRRVTARLDAESGNIGAAIGWTLDADRDETALRIVGSLGSYWFTSLSGDAAVWAPRAVARAGRVEQRIRARALLAAGMALCDAFGDDRPVEWLGEAIATFRELGHDPGVGASLFWLGRALAVRGDPSSPDLFTESEQVHERLGDVFGVGWCRSWLGHCARVSGEIAQAEALQLSVLDLGEAHGIPHIVGGALHELAKIAQTRDRGEAAAFIERALEIFRELGDRWEVTACLRELARIVLGNDPPRAAAALDEAISIGESLAAESGLADTLWLAAVILIRAGRTSEAATVAAPAVDVLRLGTANPAIIDDRDGLLRLVAEPDHASAVAEGRRLGLIRGSSQAQAWLQDVYDPSSPQTVGT